MNWVETSSLMHFDANSHSLELWHKSLGHLNANMVKMLQSIVSNMDMQAMLNDLHSLMCKGCVQGKQIRQPFSTNGGTCTTKILNFVLFDVCWPMKTPFVGDPRSFLTFIDDVLRKIWVYVLKSKSEVLTKFNKCKTLVKRQLEHVVKVTNGEEYITKAFNDFLSKHGLARQNLSPYTLQQNTVVVRTNRTILDMTRSMIHTQRLGHEFWAVVMCNTVYGAINVEQRS